MQNKLMHLYAKCAPTKNSRNCELLQWLRPQQNTPKLQSMISIKSFQCVKAEDCVRFIYFDKDTARREEFTYINTLIDTADHHPADFTAIVREIRDIYRLAHVVYHAAFVPGVPTEERAVYLTYEDAWKAEYFKNEYFRIDPVEAAARQAIMPVDWANVDQSSTEEVRRFFLAASSYGVGRQEVSIPVRHPGGAYGVFTFTSNASDREWEVEKYRNLLELLYIAKLLHQRYVLAATEAKPVRFLSLTQRERQALALLASGYEIKQIADRFGRSQTTIRNDLNSARLKLDSASPYQAATKAVVHGLINAWELVLHFDPQRDER
ncbi:autoinducer binding domain-containing protein [Agrobacterium sp. NPDC089420]|uniref:helix-turn-helix transcriptional regulator n=1 Tax=Agrobacterium sp. NPDC089420 TaxID=3363918 RepID=UPI00384BECBB